MIKIAEIGDRVFYVGIIEHMNNYSNNILERLKEFFIVGGEYIIDNITKERDIVYFNFRGFVYSYPSEFFVLNEKDMFEKRYNLR